jgi:hypothetical protein
MTRKSLNEVYQQTSREEFEEFDRSIEAPLDFLSSKGLTSETSPLTFVNGHFLAIDDFEQNDILNAVRDFTHSEYPLLAQ